MTRGSAEPDCSRSGAPAQEAPLYAYYMVAVLTIAFMVAMIDRVVLALLIDPIQAEFDISDTEMGLLSGLAFALFYLVMSIPIGRLANRAPRRLIITAGITLWSAMTALCGLAQVPLQLFVARVGVGVGESSLSPAAYSMMADLFPRDRLTRLIRCSDRARLWAPGWR